MTSNERCSACAVDGPPPEPSLSTFSSLGDTGDAETGNSNGDGDTGDGDPGDGDSGSCGDGVVDPGEECDDGNDDEADDCTPTRHYR